MKRRVLVIRYGGFGDIVMFMGAFRAIREHHRGDHITALTTHPYRPLLAQSGCFDAVLVDERPEIWQVRRWTRLIRTLRKTRFDRVYDIQRNDRTALLYRLLRIGRAIEWSGVIRGCSHYIEDDPADRRHVVDRVSEQLALAGVESVRPDRFDWLHGNLSSFALPSRYGLVVPGGAPHRPEKRASPALFAAIGRHWLAKGITPVVLGTRHEREQIDATVAGCPGARNFCEQTQFGDLAELARHAEVAVGNDTGVMHLTAAIGCPSVVLFSSASDPAQIRPLGPRVRIVQERSLADLKPEAAIAAAEAVQSRELRSVAETPP